MLKPVMKVRQGRCFQGPIPAKKPILNKYVAARLKQQREDKVYSPNCWLPQHSLKIKKIQEMKWPSARARKGTKRQQFHFNGCSHYFCSDTHHAPLDGSWGGGGDKIKWRFPILYWRQISLDENTKEGKFRLSNIGKRARVLNFRIFHLPQRVIIM